MRGYLALAYGVSCYVVFLLILLWTAAFLGNVAIPSSIDRGEPTPLPDALAIDFLLIVLFGLQHSGMARQGFKRWWTRWIPAVIERSTYVLASCLALLLLMGLWRPIPVEIWYIDSGLAAAMIHALGLAGLVLIAVASFQMAHFDLVGLRQVYRFARGLPYSSPVFQDPPLYRVVRHPMMLGALVALWATATLTLGRLVFNAGMTVYILIGIMLEERTLLREFGPSYRDYQRRVGMLWPRVLSRSELK